MPPGEWDALPWWEQELYWRHLSDELGINQDTSTQDQGDDAGNDEESYAPSEQPDIGEFAGFGVRMVS